MVLEWAFEHRDELVQDWELAQNGKVPNKIEPLVYGDTMIWVEDARYISGYRAFVKFNDGRESIIDFENYIHLKPNGTILNHLKR